MENSKTDNHARTILPDEASNGIVWKQEELWGMLSHDLRTPLNAIQGFLDLLVGTRLEAEQRECVEMAIEGTESLRSILDGILECAKIDSGRFLISKQATNLRELVASVIHQYQMQAASAGLDLRLEVAADLPNLISFDKGKLRQILGNLIGNALKFTERGQVIVRVDHVLSEEKVLRLDIIDSGIGISNDHLMKVFEAFYQGNQESLKQSSSIGLGLAIVKRLVDTLSGKVEIWSEKGHGTTVTVWLPYK